MFEDFPVISSYSDEEAAADGILMDVTDKLGIEGGRWYVTSGIVEAINKKDDGRTFDQKLIPLVTDAIMLVNQYLQKARDNGAETYKDLIEQGYTLVTEGLEGNVTDSEVWIGMNGSRGWTLMFPSDR